MMIAQSDVDGCRQAKKRGLLAAYATCGTITDAAKVAECHRSSHSNWITTDPEYAAAFADAKRAYIEKLEREADRRAMGWEEPVFNKDGQQIGVKPKHSDLLLIFRLKALAPEKYAERRQVDQRVNVQVSAFQSMKPSERIAELDRMRELAAACQPSLPADQGNNVGDQSTVSDDVIDVDSMPTEPLNSVPACTDDNERVPADAGGGAGDADAPLHPTSQICIDPHTDEKKPKKIPEEESQKIPKENPPILSNKKSKLKLDRAGLLPGMKVVERPSPLAEGMNCG